ncbi:MAG: DUF3826 domain-containing protein [Chitinophagaceae bacterium]
MKRLMLVNDNFIHERKQPAGLDPYSIALSYLSPIIKKLLIILLVVCCSVFTYAQTTTEQQQADYKKAITERSAKIVNTLGITDSANYKRTLEEIANQYFNLNDIQQQNKSAVDAIKAKALPKEEETAAIQKEEEKKSSQLLQLHNAFVAHIKGRLTDSQVDQVKDGMTYRVFPITYTAYLDMIPTLTTEQKAQIYDWLKEAREVAMDAESSDKKHAMFGIYKGRINNYLSKAGYDMKKEGEDWQKRIKEREQAKAQ